ncbi:MAG: hypothetical protein ACKO6E_11205 [Planctomycetota bacterium]
MIHPPVLAAADIRHRLESRLLAGYDDWWQGPATLAAVAAFVAAVVWIYRRDAAELSPARAAALAALRIAALAAVAVGLLGIERVAEHEVVLPSRVAVLVDASASMSLPASAADEASRSQRAVELLVEQGALAELGKRHAVTVWRFADDVEAVSGVPAGGTAPWNAADWQARLAPRGVETRLGSALARVLADGPSGTLAGVLVISDGGGNAGIDPVTAAKLAAQEQVKVQAIGLGAERPRDEVRIAELIAPARVFPGDRFAVTAFLQPHGLAGRTVRVELLAGPAIAGQDPQPIDAVDVLLGADGELMPVRFDVAGIEAAGRRILAVRVMDPAGGIGFDAVPRQAEVEVVDRVTSVLLMAGGPGREYQFLRNVLSRDRSFAVDVLLGTASDGMSQDARNVVDRFPEDDDALRGYDVVVAIDPDWRGVDPAAQARLERWVAEESGGLVLVAGPVHTESWLGDPRSSKLRDLAPVEPRRVGPSWSAGGGAAVPRRLLFSRDGDEAEFLWLAETRAASEERWREFPGIYACFPIDRVKAGATEYARAAAPSGSTGDLFLVGQAYGAGIVVWVGSGELWRLRGVELAAHERLVTQLLRHVSQGRMLRGGRWARLMVDRDRCPVGSVVAVRVVVGDAAAISRPPVGRVVAPDGAAVPLALEPEPARPGTLVGSFVAAREGAWLVEVDAVSGDERLERRVEAHLPERELAHPLLDRGVLERIAVTSGGSARFLVDAPWSAADTAAVAAAFPDRSRHEFETGGFDPTFKRRLNTLLLTVAATCLCLEWIGRRLARLA